MACDSGKVFLKSLKIRTGGLFAPFVPKGESNCPEMEWVSPVSGDEIDSFPGDGPGKTERRNALRKCAGQQ